MTTHLVICFEIAKQIKENVTKKLDRAARSASNLVFSTRPKMTKNAYFGPNLAAFAQILLRKSEQKFAYWGLHFYTKGFVCPSPT